MSIQVWSQCSNQPPTRTTREILLPKLGECRELKVGVDFFLHSPRSEWIPAQGLDHLQHPESDWRDYPGMHAGGCCLVWSGAKEVVPVSSAEVAEMAKLLENTFRMINIGLVNEMAICAIV